jgi:hypothetical protein
MTGERTSARATFLLAGTSLDEASGDVGGQLGDVGEGADVDQAPKS